MSSLEDESLKSQQEFYDDRWSDASDRYEVPNQEARERVTAIIECVMQVFKATNRPLRILDLGCGNGWMTRFLSPFGMVTGVDLSKEGIRQAAERYRDHEFFTASYFEYENNGEFDIVVSQEVLEHIELDEQLDYLKRCRENLNESGRLILTTPNRKAVKAIRRGKGLSLDKLGDQPIENILSRRELKQLVSNDFEIIFLKTVVRPKTLSGMYRFLNSGRLASMIPGWRSLATRLNANKHLVLFASRRN